MTTHMKLALVAVLVLTGCANPQKAACALQAAGNALQGMPEPECARQIRAAEAGLPAPAPNPVLHCWRDASGQNTYCQQQ